MSIKIGNNNKINKSKIIDNSNQNLQSKDEIKESFLNKHVILVGIMCSIVASVIMMLPFWDNVSQFINNLF